MPIRILFSILMLLSLPFTLAAQPVGTTVLANITPTDGLYLRLLPVDLTWTRTEKTTMRWPQ